jgi:hypothetical protein
MRICLSALVFVLGALPAAARGQGQPQCALRYSEAFARVPALGLRSLGQAQAYAEVSALFGPRPDLCEAGAYQRFIDGFRDYAREAMRAPIKQRDGMIRVAIAIVQQSPARVPWEEGRAAVTLFRQGRSDLHATADDVGITPLMQQLLDTFERQGPPQPAQATAPPQAQPAAPAAPPAPAPQVQSVRVPTTPLPPWAVISMYELRDLLNQKNLGVAQGKVEAILKWLETAP